MMTAHTAKGLEFPMVFVVGLEEGLFPHFASLSDPSALEEERRLCYVAMTRARDRLYLTNATMRRMHGQSRFNPPSRFLDEIPADLIDGHVGKVRHIPGDSRPDAPVDSGPIVDYNEGQWDGDETPPLRSGTRVEHPIFGMGTIEETVGSGRMAKVRIRFDRAGRKTIVLRYAQLRLIP